jgi:hypothetical protein
MNQRSFSKSDSRSLPSYGDSSILLHTSSAPQQATSSQARDEQRGAVSNNVDIVLTPSQDPHVFHNAYFDPHYDNLQTNPNEKYNDTTSLPHVLANHDVGSPSHMESHALYQTDQSQYSPTHTNSTWGTDDQHYYTSSDTIIQNDKHLVDYQDNQVQLQQWAYETSNSRLTFAERLEKSNWERKRHEKL